MDKALRAQLTMMENEVRAAAVPDSGKQTALWCIGQLPPLYAKFQLTSESRYVDEIKRLVRGVLKELAHDTSRSQTGRLAIPARLQRLHEKFGLPGLNINPQVAAPRRVRTPI